MWEAGSGCICRDNTPGMWESVPGMWENGSWYVEDCFRMHVGIMFLLVWGGGSHVQ